MHILVSNLLECPENFMSLILETGNRDSNPRYVIHMEELRNMAYLSPMLQSSPTYVRGTNIHLTEVFWGSHETALSMVLKDQ